MGYAVYEDPETKGRWAGYGVPAECDMPGCNIEIDRGLGYKCESGHADEDAWEDQDEDERDPEFEDYGCGLYFCESHDYPIGDSHDKLTPKPDTLEWVHHILTDESWDQWRAENPALVDGYQKRIAAAQIVINHGGGIQTAFHPLKDKDTK